MQRSLAALTSLSFLFAVSNANAGAWLQGEGKTQAIISYSYLSTDEFFDTSGNRSNNVKFTKGEISPYIEYGYDSDWTFGASASLQSVSSNGVSGNVTDLNEYQLASTDLFARYALDEGSDYIISIEPRLKVPIVQDAGINPEGSAPIPELRLSYGKNHSLLSELDSFTDLSTTYRLRTHGDLSDMVKFDATAGIRPFDEYPVLLLGQSFYERALGDLSDANNSGNYELLKLQVSAAYEFENGVTVQTGFFSNAYGTNTAAGNGLLLSTWLSF